MSELQEFSLSDEHFRYIQNLAKELTGVTLADSKKEMVFSRIMRILRKQHMTSFELFKSELEKKNEDILHEFISAMTTHLTYFNRESHHQQFLETKIIPQLIAKKSHHARFWSAGCSMGAEAYEIAMACYQAIPDIQCWDLKILATDIDKLAIEYAKKGIYDDDILAKLPSTLKSKYFKKEDEQYHVKDILKDLIHFKTFNFMETLWPMRGPFDVIFCRNVLIYFERDIQEYFIGMFTDLIKIGGYLILGHSESIGAKNKSLKFLGQTIYQRQS